jgi:hypothetical protein
MEKVGQKHIRFHGLTVAGVRLCRKSATLVRISDSSVENARHHLTDHDPTQRQQQGIAGKNASEKYQTRRLQVVC